MGEALQKAYNKQYMQ